MRIAPSPFEMGDSSEISPRRCRQPGARLRGSVRRAPVHGERGRGSRIYDADGNEYLDYVLSWGPPILGHAHARVVASLRAAAARRTSFGAPTELETMLARLITSALPSIELISYNGGKDYVERK